jgi:ADP-heptose:LPS heptosyltransferase
MSCYDVIIYKPDRIGDFILALTSIRQLLEHFSDQKCLLVLSPAGRECAQIFFPDTEILCLETGCEIKSYRQFPAVLKEFMQMIRLKSNILISLKHHKREVDVLYEWAIPASKKFTCVGDLSVKRLSGLTKPSVAYPKESESGLCRELTAHNALLSQALGSLVSGSNITTDAGTSAPSSPTVTVCPFASDARRDLSPHQIAKEIPEDARTIRLLLQPTDEDRGRSFSEELSRLTPGTPVQVRICPGLREFFQAIRESDFVISSESAAAHAAVFYQRAGVGFLGGGHFGYFAPWGTGPFTWKYKKMECYLCNWNCRYKEIRCLTEL